MGHIQAARSRGALAGRWGGERGGTRNSVWSLVRVPQAVDSRAGRWVSPITVCDGYGHLPPCFGWAQVPPRDVAEVGAHKQPASFHRECPLSGVRLAGWDMRQVELLEARMQVSK